jgi:hypothetical protein
MGPAMNPSRGIDMYSTAEDIVRLFLLVSFVGISSVMKR